MRSSDLVLFANRRRLVGQPLLTYRQLDYWARCGLLEAPGRGSGSRREFSHAEARVALLMGYLTEAGLRLEAAAVIARRELAREPSVMDASPVTILVNLSAIEWPDDDSS